MKSKIINDPVYGLLKIDSGVIQQIIDHPYFQRLRRIKQTGLADLVYPGAVHTRFQHSIGAMHLMSLAISSLREKGRTITAEEEEAAKVAILLHDIGHGPFSHCLEGVFTNGDSHEIITLDFIDYFWNKLYDYKDVIELAKLIFTNNYKKKFLYQLISSQLDVDRLDYLKRDSFFTGVVEGNIGVDRIIQMLEVVDDNLIVEAKGIYSIEKFLIARRLMYWQVYYHKTVVIAENLLRKTIERMKYLVDNKEVKYYNDSIIHKLSNNYMNDCYKYFLKHTFIKNIDDNDVIAEIKNFSNYYLSEDDKILKLLSNSFLNRKLPKIIFSKEPFDKTLIKNISDIIINRYQVDVSDVHYYLFQGEISTKTYNDKQENIKILTNNTITDISEVSDVINTNLLDKEIKKYYICVPKEILNCVKLN